MRFLFVKKTFTLFEPLKTFGTTKQILKRIYFINFKRKN